MAFNTRTSAFVALFCIALTLCVQAAEEQETWSEQPANDTSRSIGDCNCVCGQSRSMRIVGGTRAARGEYPWLVAMFNKGSYYCGGTLITDRHVLTAAHCFHRIRRWDVTIQLGAYDIKDKSERSLMRNIKTLSVHPDFDMMIGYDSDVAVVELDEPVNFGAWDVGTACLPDETYVDYKGEKGDDWGTVVGRGRTKENGVVSAVPLKVDLPLMSMNLCRSSGYGPSKITDNMLCAGFYIGNKDACQGDSGGPLHRHLNNTEESSSEIVGVVSWGRGCARRNLPGVYTRVQKFIPWIREQISGGCECRKL